MKKILRFNPLALKLNGYPDNGDPYSFKKGLFFDINGTDEFFSAQKQVEIDIALPIGSPVGVTNELNGMFLSELEIHKYTLEANGICYIECIPGKNFRNTGSSSQNDLMADLKKNWQCEISSCSERLRA